MNCPKCQSPLKKLMIVYDGQRFQNGRMTLLAIQQMNGHVHDPNCYTAEYVCDNNHRVILSTKNKCPMDGCSWIREGRCFCHFGSKLDRLPEITEERVCQAGDEFERIF